MSHSHEPSYYEIALTNRQVLVVFVVLLLCVVAAFFSGVWVGRGDAADAAVAAADTGSADSEAPVSDAEAVGELHFFTDRDAEPGPESSLAEIAETPAGETTLLEDLGGVRPQAQAESGSGPAATPQPQSETSAAQPSASAEPEPTVEVATGYVIQVFSSADEDQARRLVDELAGGGFPAFLSPVQVGSQTMVRVRIGPYPDLKEAEGVADRIRRQFKLDTWVTR